jgi:CRP-like cAMP-binding protein
MDKRELLSKVGLFSGLSDEDLNRLAEFAVELTFKKDETLIKQGERGVGLYVVVSGEVKIVKKTAGGDELEVALHGSGDFFGEMAVLDDAPRSASVIAVVDTECLFLSAWDFKARMKLHPQIATEILPVVVKRFRETNERLLALSRL